jgi:uncharacterized lipoprotein YehR (DUF1307 family)
LNNKNLQSQDIYKSQTLVPQETEFNSTPQDINSGNIYNFIPESTFHPSMFQQEKYGVDTADTNSIQNILNERASGLATSDVTNLKSPGGYFLTPSQDDYSKNISNTSSLFKNVHGETLLTWLFFSDANLKQIQNVIKYLIYKYIGKVIDDQSKEELLIIMRSIYLQYFNQPINYRDDLDQATKNLAISQTQVEVKRLNGLVIDEIVPKIISELQQYLDYLRDASKPFGGRDTSITPVDTNIKGERIYRSTTSVLLGGNF